jgi:hypothetical protein
MDEVVDDVSGRIRVEGERHRTGFRAGSKAAISQDPIGAAGQVALLPCGQGVVGLEPRQELGFETLESRAVPPVDAHERVGLLELRFLHRVTDRSGDERISIGP